MRFLLAVLLMAASALAQNPIRYTLSFPSAQNHYVDVEATYPVRGSELEVFMAVWTPGSYLVREYARNVESVTASQGSIAKSRKNRWKVSGLSGNSVTLKYRVYSREMSVRTNWVEAGFAILNGAPTFLWPVGNLQQPAEVTVQLPANWKQAVAALPFSGTTFRVADYDTLVDSPIYAGNAALYAFEVAGKKLTLLNEGEAGIWDGPRSAKDAQKIVEQQVKLFGNAPFENYVFFNMLTESGGGLEHKNSTVLMGSRFATRNKASYSGGLEEGRFQGGWLGLVSHEFFHVWNVKRLRPIELGPFDYENENYVDTLWIAEGFTSYYGDLINARAGFLNTDEYLAGISGEIEALQSAPGHLVTPAALSSYDAWIKQYRPDENTRNTTISYYTKGAVVGLLLDVKIRQTTAGKKSLDDVMRLMYQRYSGEKGYTAQDFKKTVSEVAGSDLSAWITEATETTKELDYNELLSWFGLRWRAGAGNDTRAYLGAETQAGNINSVLRNTPAYAAGLNVGDELIAIDNLRVTQDTWRRRLRIYKPGDKVQVLVSRRGQLLTLPVTLGSEPVQRRLEVDPKQTPEQKARLAEYLKGL